MSLNDVDPRYPVGRFPPPSIISPDERNDAIATLAELPEQLRNAVDGLSFAQLNTPYREGGWTSRQVVHHVADSHMNAVIRVKLALTEDWPTIKPYDEAAWAKLHDVTLEALKVPALQEKLAKLGVDPGGGTPEAFRILTKQRGVDVGKKI